MPLIEEDLEAVERALRAARSHAYANRYGGLNDLWLKLNRAQEALQRLGEVVRVRQPRLFE
jgi:hypothetical protein